MAFPVICRAISSAGAGSPLDDSKKSKWSTDQLQLLFSINADRGQDGPRHARAQAVAAEYNAQTGEGREDRAVRYQLYEKANVVTKKSRTAKHGGEPRTHTADAAAARCLHKRLLTFLVFGS